MDPARAFDPSKIKAGAAKYSSSDDDDDDDDEYMKPSADPRVDDFADFNPRKRRRTGRDAKESAALGVFGSESEDEGPSWRWKRKALRTKGMSFVSADNTAKDSDEEMGDDDGDDPKDSDGARPSMRPHHDDEDDDDDDEEEEGTPGIGLGFKSAAGLGSGWMNPGGGAAGAQANPLAGFGMRGARGKRPAFKPFVQPKDDSNQPLGRGFVPSSDNQPVLDTTMADSPSNPQVAAKPSAFSTKRGKSKINANSFSARMMAKMGFVEGQGLGKEGTGRVVHIEANLRPQGVGLGAVKEKTKQEREEEKRQARMRGEVVIDSDEEEKKKKAERKKRALAGGSLRSGTGSAASTPKRQQKPKYMTVDEVKRAAPGLDIPDAFTPILDMTGSAKKMLTSSSGLMTPTTGAAEEGDAQSRKLVKRAQNDFMAILEEWQGLQERKAYAELRLRQEQQELEELEKDVASHQLLASVFDELMQLEQPEDDEIVMGGRADTKKRWDRVLGMLRKANDSVSDLTIHVVKEEMASTAVAAIHPILKDMLEDWNPLASPRADYASDLVSVKSLLGIDRPSEPQARSSATPYESLMYKLWLPHVSRSVREWNVKDADCMIAVYEAWHPVLPAFVRTYFLEQDIIRKLDEAIAKWEPKRKRQQHSLPHLWIFPWLQYLPHHHLDPKSSTGLVADVKRKFRQLIDVWEFDRGVVPGLKEWKTVLRPSKANDQWKPLVMTNILPNMARYLGKNFRVQPSDQEPYLQALSGVLEWRYVVSPTLVAEVVVAEVFPKWHEILFQWLVDEYVSYEDIAQWCEWWHDADGPLPAEIRDTISVASEFEKGLHTIERALDLFDLGEDPKAALAPPPSGPAYAAPPANGRHHRSSHTHHHRHREQQKRQEAAAAAAATVVDKDQKRTFRHVVEDWCQENDLQFIPERKQHHSEGPLYRITARGDGKGGKLGYFKGDKLCVLTKSGVDEFGESGGDLERLMTQVM